MNDPLLLWSSLILVIVLLIVLAVGKPSMFMLDLIHRLFYHGRPIHR